MAPRPFLQEHAVRELAGPGPFTVFAPLSSSFNHEPRVSRRRGLQKGLGKGTASEAITVMAVDKRFSLGES